MELMNRKSFDTEGAYIVYFRRMIRMETPQMQQGQGNDEYDEICRDYCQLRNRAKGLLDQLGVK